MLNDSCSNRFLSVNSLFILLFASYYLLPSMSISYNILYPVIMGFIYLCIVVYRKQGEISKKVILYLGLIFLIVFLYMVFSDSITISSSVNNSTIKRFISELYQLEMMFLPLLFLNWTVEEASKKERMLICFFSYIVIAYVLYSTFQELLIAPNITKHWADFAETAVDNIANYNFVYAVPFVIVFCALVITKIDRFFVKAILFGLIAFQIYFLILSQYTLSFLTSIIGIMILIYCRAKKRGTRFFLLIAIILLIIGLSDILSIIASIIPSDQIRIRLNEISTFLSGGDFGYNMDGRTELYLKSIKAFLDSPIWGNRRLNFNGHATLLVVPAQLGLIGAVPYYYLIFLSKKIVRRIICDIENNFSVFFIMFLLIAYTNPVNAALPVMYVLWYLVPLSIWMIVRREGNILATSSNLLN